MAIVTKPFTIWEHVGMQEENQLMTSVEGKEIISF